MAPAPRGIRPSWTLQPLPGSHLGRSARAAGGSAVCARHHQRPLPFPHRRGAAQDDRGASPLVSLISSRLKHPFSLPSFSLPSVSLPSFSLPSFSLPSVSPFSPFSPPREICARLQRCSSLACGVSPAISTMGRSESKWGQPHRPDDPTPCPPHSHLTRTATRVPPLPLFRLLPHRPNNRVPPALFTCQRSPRWTCSSGRLPTRSTTSPAS